MMWASLRGSLPSLLYNSYLVWLLCTLASATLVICATVIYESRRLLRKKQRQTSAFVVSNQLLTTQSARGFFASIPAMSSFSLILVSAVSFICGSVCTYVTVKSQAYNQVYAFDMHVLKRTGDHQYWVEVDGGKPSLREFCNDQPDPMFEAGETDHVVAKYMGSCFSIAGDMGYTTVRLENGEIVKEVSQ